MSKPVPELSWPQNELQKSFEFMDLEEWCRVGCDWSCIRSGCEGFFFLLRNDFFGEVLSMDIVVVTEQKTNSELIDAF